MTRFASSTTKEGFKRAVLPGVLGGKLCGTTSSPRKCTVSDVAITNFRKRRAGGTDSVTVDFEITVAASQKEIAKTLLTAYLKNTGTGGMNEQLQKDNTTSGATAELTVAPQAQTDNTTSSASSEKVMTPGIIALIVITVLSVVLACVCVGFVCFAAGRSSKPKLSSTDANKNQSKEEEVCSDVPVAVPLDETRASALPHHSPRSLKSKWGDLSTES